MLDQLRAKFAVHPVDIGLLHHLLWRDFICPGERVMTCQGQAQPLLEQRLDRQFEIRFRRIGQQTHVILARQNLRLRLAGVQRMKKKLDLGQFLQNERPEFGKDPRRNGACDANIDLPAAPCDRVFRKLGDVFER